MKNWIKIFLIVEIQIVLVLLIVAIIKTNNLDSKVYNTNKFVYEALIDKRVKALNVIKENDIIVGNPNAPVTIFLYSRFDCSVCNDFFDGSYERLKADFIDEGKVRLVVRYLVHSSKLHILYATKSAYYTNISGCYDLFAKRLRNQYPDMDSTAVKEIVLDLTKNSEDFSGFVSDKTIEDEILQFAATIREAGIRSTPTIFINRQRLTGNSGYGKLKEIILFELENQSCEE
jgi:protein-disulfide isomerase